MQATNKRSMVSYYKGSAHIIAQMLSYSEERTKIVIILTMSNNLH